MSERRHTRFPFHLLLGIRVMLAALAVVAVQPVVVLRMQCVSLPPLLLRLAIIQLRPWHLYRAGAHSLHYRDTLRLQVHQAVVWP